MTKPTSLYAAFLTLVIVPLYAQEADDTPPAVTQAEESLEAAADEEVLEAPDDGEPAITAAPEQRPANAPLSFTYEEFMEADQDGNGILSIEEANAAFPDLSFEDANGDSFLNHAEADAALEGLNLTIEGAGTWSVVGESDFLTMLRTLEEREQNARSAAENAQNARNGQEADGEQVTEQS